MALSGNEKIMCGVVLAAATFAAGTVFRGCGGNPGEGTVKVDPTLPERIGNPPEVQRPAGRKPISQPRGLKSRLRKNAGVK